ncbi:MAG: S-adenosylmethionine decarboxylase [Candidatus Pacebacteria bacterium]|nr:S-adenosylmethionine decarboxylase [Candidatus Paceibacterota bacterium]
MENFQEEDKKIIEKYKAENPWGMSICVDLKNCDSEKMKDAEKVKEFVDKLVNLLKMRKFGETTVVDFGDNPRVTGFSMTQLIETSLISGHFANNSKAIYLDIFSCKEYPPYQAAEFCKEFFGASSYDIKVNFRH